MIKRYRQLWSICFRAILPDFLKGAPWLPLYSSAEVGLAVCAAILLQLIFIDTPRVLVSDLIPGGFKHWAHFGQILDRQDLVFILPALLVAFGFAKLVSGFASSYFIERAGHRMAHTLREKLLKSFLSSSGNHLDHKNIDVMANRVMQDTTLLQGAIAKGTVTALRDAIVLVGLVVAMLIISWQSFLIGLLLMVPMGWGLSALAKKIQYYSRGGQMRQVGLSARLLSTHQGVLTVHALRSQGREQEDFETLNHENEQFMKQSLFVRTFFSPLVEFIALAFLAGLVFFKISFLTDQNQVVTYTAILLLLAFSFRYIKNIANTVTFFVEIGVVLERVQQNLAEHPAPKASRPTFARSPRDALEMRRVGYTTEGGQPIIQQCSLKIHRGSRVLFIGPSGAGKTTCLRLLAGVLEPTEGHIDRGTRVLYASQTPYVFRGTVAENISYVAGQEVPAPVAKHRSESLVLALSLAYSHSGAQLFLKKNIGFLGQGLSGGEQARVALGRILFEDPETILLDEPTANLDAASAQAFWQALERWKEHHPERTLVAVTHSLHEVEHFDYAYVFSGGTVVNHGTVAEMRGYVAS